MYQAFYKLKENPFRLIPDPAFLCMTAQHREALSGLIYSVCNRSGLTVLMGEAGTGKTTLLYVLLGLLNKQRYLAAVCTNPTLTRDEFYDFLIAKFGIDCPSPLKSRRLIALQETLLRNRADGRRAVLVIDEAQRLPMELLEEVRLLLNLETPQEKLLEIIVAGQPELGEILHRPELRQLKQRVSCFCKLKPLSLEELKEYLHHRVTRAGLPQQSLFPEDTIKLIHEYTDGIPRLVNSLCDASLQTGFALQAPRVTASIIEEAARDLELVRTTSPKEALLNGAGKNGTPLAAERVVPIAAPVVPAPETVRNGNGTSVPKVPLESYVSRQKSLGFFAHLMDLWK